MIAFDTLTAARLQRSMKKGMWHKRYRVLVQIPECVAEAMQEEKDPSSSSSSSSSKKSSDATRCALFNPLLKGSLINVSGNSIMLAKKGSSSDRLSEEEEEE